MLKIKYLTDTHFRGFEKYKYSCIDTGILSVKVMHPFWNRFVQIFPKTIAPNLITFTGFLLTVLNFILIGYYDYSFLAANHNETMVPNWVWLLAAFNLFLAYNLDGVDGKQARRTGTSGPLGELFDHGLDSYSTVFIPILVFSLFGRDDLSTIRMHFVIWNVFLNFYTSHFEKYNTGVMFLPWAYDFTMWGVSIVLAISGIVGAWIWRVPLPYDIPPARAFEVFLHVSAIISNYPIVARNIYISYRDKTGKMRTFMEAARPLFPFSALFIISTMWVMFSHNHVSDLDPRLIFLIVGTIFSNINVRLIVAQMSDVRTDGWNYLLWPLLCVVIICTFPLSLFNMEKLSEDVERYIVYTLFTICTIIHLHYGYSIVSEMCDHFKIKCFKVRKLNDNNKKNNQQINLINIKQN